MTTKMAKTIWCFLKVQFGLRFTVSSARSSIKETVLKFLIGTCPFFLNLS